MSLSTADLPTDPDALRAFALACQAELKVAEISVQLRALEIEKLRFQIAKLRRMQFGRSSERITRQIEQLELQLEELETGTAAVSEAVEDAVSIGDRAQPKRKPLPDHLPRHEVIHEPEGDGEARPAHSNGFDPEKVPGYVERIEELHSEIDDIMAAAQEKCRPLRERHRDDQEGSRRRR